MTLEQAILDLGLGLQLTGIGAAAWGISDVRRSFSDEPSVLTKLRSRLKRLSARTRRFFRRVFRRKREHHATAMADVLGAAGMMAEGTVSLGAPRTTDPLPDRVAALEVDLRRVEKRLQDDVRNERKTRELAVSEERDQRTAADDGLNKKVKKLATGGLRLETFGLTAILIGTVLATVPTGVAGIVRNLTPL